ncbi:MAG TPA: coproporphyrinogen III oxidase [Leptolyngbyaceae cyanobacterium M33_DOE_097]|uniref:Heme chaperone HemW n=1 Tax=Oscillatoriales cyanobacterium SpSt-418 TaxID=2282169 RepID=A0A7C3PL49_9CYAN|nr:coproporphyrinogen III oxidase [Leptolyngbyaceae cyanobacterium M33_DOE_097]
MLSIEVSAPGRSAIATAAYIHIPFCRRRCFYCDFPIAVVGDRLRGEASGTIRQYVATICQEIRQSVNFGKPLATIFFGGGTPSLLAPTQLNQILETLNQTFGIAPTAEISIEIDPATFDLAQVQGYKAAGVNRVSLGVQAFQPKLLAQAGRSHTVEDIKVAFHTLRQAEFENISLDLISGLPYQTLADWQASLEQAIALNPTHLSCYDLTVEAGTPFSRQYKPGLAPLPSDEMTAEMYRLAHQTLTQAGYSHYEISNYAKPGYQCQHNRVYWENRPFYGFGMGATSYLQAERLARPRKTHEYYEWVQQQANFSPSHTPSDPTEILLDTLMLGLRLAEGVDLDALSDRFGQAVIQRVLACLAPYEKQGWLMIERPVSHHLGRIWLTQPEGFLFSNVLLVKLFESFAD